MFKVLVTGSDGYIGSHVVKRCAELGYEVHGLDTRIHENYNDVSKYLTQKYPVDVRCVKSFYFDCDFDSVIHLAALISVEESVRKPDLYRDVNYKGTVNLINNIPSPEFIFGSTAAAFTPEASPYGSSKRDAEVKVKMANKWNTVFRFFNVAGSGGEFGQVGPSTHLIKIAAETAAGKRESITINGNDYDTPDGTCYREYIHVSDLADAIVSAVEKPSNLPFECLSLQTSYSNIEVIETMRRVTNKPFKYDFGPRREGDPAMLSAPSTSEYLFNKTLHTLEDMCLSAYEMELRTK